MQFDKSGQQYRGSSPYRPTTVDAKYDKLATVVGRTKLTILVKVDVRLTTNDSLSHSASTSVYITMRVRLRVALVHL